MPAARENGPASMLSLLSSRPNVHEVAEMLGLGEQTVRDYRKRVSLIHGWPVGYKARQATSNSKNPAPTARAGGSKPVRKTGVYVGMLDTP